jgi:hypothetical protein
MKLFIKLALVALLIEAANFWFLIPPLDVGLSPDASWFTTLIADQWVCLHWLGFFLLNWLAKIGLNWTGIGYFSVLFASGYLETALLFSICIFGSRSIRHMATKYSAKRN